ncbi:MAG: hypothetical protein ACJ77A_03795 [Actinomycetota bacterium]
MEPWVNLRLQGDGLGQVSVSGTADDKVSTGNKLQFRFELDQTWLPKIIEDLEALMREFPVVGGRE